MKEALFYTRAEGGKLRCLLCPNVCIIEEGDRGSCNVRVNMEGRLIAQGYGNISAIAMDPIEKKPLYHFYPGSNILSVGGLWCNLRCSFCQNWHIAHREGETQFISPESLITMAKEYGSIGIAFTYNEPIINYEYILDTGILAADHNLKIVLVTNGYILPEPLEKLLPHIDAMNIDVKGFTEEYYREVCGGSLSPIKRAVELAAGHCHVELTTLVVGGVNDGAQEMESLFRWIKGIDPYIPLHLSRYLPNYKMNLPGTEVETMMSLKALGDKYLNHIYLGNMGGVDNNTYCPNCRELLIDRGHYRARAAGISQEARCSGCSSDTRRILGAWGDK
ncbi:MAG TPA: AmmeMemoRadiSam system radical SAM enzyme [Clostridia bacterium]|nr:AmmeMemoRadiSam system radical SAM enzyme [Clostridia bacterium]